MRPTTLGKLYLIPITLGDNDPLEVLPITIKRTIDFQMSNKNTNGCVL